MFQENAIKKLPRRYSNLHYDCLQLPDHWVLLPLDNSYRTINVLKAFFSATHAVWSSWCCIYHEFKELLRKISLNECFQAISHYFRVSSLSGLTVADDE